MDKQQEELLALYEKYMDDATLEAISEADDLEEIGYQINKKGYNDSRFPQEMTIPIDEFVNNYLGIRTDCTGLWHQGLKSIGSSLVIGVDNDIANKNPETVYRGELLVVVDARGNRGTYINPRILLGLLESNEDIEKQFRDYCRTGVQNLALLSSYLQGYFNLKKQVEANRKGMHLLAVTHATRKFNRLKKEREHA